MPQHGGVESKQTQSCLAGDGLKCLTYFLYGVYFKRFSYREYDNAYYITKYIKINMLEV